MTIEFYKFATLLENKMKKHNIDINTLSKKSGISVSYISNLLNGVRTPTKEKTLILAKTLNESVEEFLEAAGFTNEELKVSDFNNIEIPFQQQINDSPSKTNEEIKNIIENYKKEAIKDIRTIKDIKDIRDPVLLSLVSKYDFPIELVPIFEQYRTLSPSRKQAWLTIAETTLKVIKKLDETLE